MTLDEIGIRLIRRVMNSGYRTGAIASLIMAAQFANAAITVTETLTSDYESQGETQTENAPAFQLAVKLTQVTGWYEQIFMSNVGYGNSKSFGDPHLELKPYLGYAVQLSTTMSIDAGAKYYTYMLNGGASYNYGAAYVNLTDGWVRAGLSYAPNYDGRSSPKHVGAWYSFADLTVPLQAHMSLLGHLGYSSGEYWTRFGGGRQADYSIGTEYSVDKYNFFLQYIGRVIVGEETGLANEARIVVSVQKRFSFL